MSNEFYLTFAYGLTWVVVVAYAVYLARRVSRAERRVNESNEQGGRA